MTNRMGRDFSAVTRTKTWGEPPKWNRKGPELAATLGRRVRVFCASLTDFFIQDSDPWRDEAWDVIRQCTEMDWLILTKRPALITPRLPEDWGQGWPHVWLGTTCGVRSSYPRLDALRKVPAAIRFISAEPLLESLADINLDGFHWLIAGGGAARDSARCARIGRWNSVTHVLGKVLDFISSSIPPFGQGRAGVVRQAVPRTTAYSDCRFHRCRES